MVDGFALNDSPYSSFEAVIRFFLGRFGPSSVHVKSSSVGGGAFVNLALHRRHEWLESQTGGRPPSHRQGLTRRSPRLLDFGRDDVPKLVYVTRLDISELLGECTNDVDEPVKFRVCVSPR